MSSKISELSELTSLSSDDELVVVDKSDTTMASSGTNKRIKYQNIAYAYTYAGGRLSLQSNVDVSSTDQVGKNILIYTPSTSNLIGLWDGISWKPVTFTETYYTLTGLTNNTNYDVFGYLSGGGGGSLTLDAIAWSNNTTRDLPISRFSGVYTLDGDVSYRYLGTFRTTSTSTTEDSMAKRFVWNYYNRVERPLRVVDTTDSWVYTTEAYRAANNSNANRVEFVTGLSQTVSATLSAAAYLGAANFCYAALGLDSTTTPSGIYNTGFGSDVSLAIPAYYHGILMGYHYLQWLEYGSAGGGGGTVVWFGDNGGTMQSGISGILLG